MDTLNNKITLEPEKAEPASLQTSSQPLLKKSKRKFPKWAKILLSFFLAFLLFVGGLAFFLGRPAWEVFVSAQEVMRQSQEVSVAFKEQDLIRAQEEVGKTKEKLEDTREKFQQLNWLKSVPLVKNYVFDGDHLFNAGRYGLEGAEMALAALIPHADIIGFKGEEEKEVQSAEDKLFTVLRSLKEISPQLDQIEEKLKLTKEEIGQIDENRYPQTIKGVALRERIIQAKVMIDTGADFLSRAKPIIEVLPQILGDSEERKYLVLFQNDGEIRPTGGFLTAYALIRADQGKIRAVKSSDMYDLDARFTKRIDPPEPIQKHLKVNRWYLRDMNFSPDFKTSMETFSQYYQTIGEEEVTGIIAVDTKVLKDLIDILGPVNVPGYGTFTSENAPECDCPQVIYELELLADKPLGELNPQRKAVLGPMMQEVLFNALGAPKNLWPALFEKILELIEEKHILFYFHDEKEQRALEVLGGAGRIKDYDGDYLHINEANFGGAKSNLYIQQEVEQIIEEKDGKLLKTINITYKNPQKASNCDLEAGELCLNGPCPTWIRVYLPSGTKLIEALGSEVAVETSEEFNKTVFAALLTIRPEGVAQISFKVELPAKFKEVDNLKLLIQKQPGKKEILHRLVINGQEEEFELKKDREVEVNF